jgi:hypothetical protein
MAHLSRLRTLLVCENSGRPAPANLPGQIAEHAASGLAHRPWQRLDRGPAGAVGHLGRRGRLPGRRRGQRGPGGYLPPGSGPRHPGRPQGPARPARVHRSAAFGEATADGTPVLGTLRALPPARSGSPGPPRRAEDRNAERSAFRVSGSTPRPAERSKQERGFWSRPPGQACRSGSSTEHPADHVGAEKGAGVTTQGIVSLPHDGRSGGCRARQAHAATSRPRALSRRRVRAHLRESPDLGRLPAGLFTPPPAGHFMLGSAQ